jgi:hypothetical protein
MKSSTQRQLLQDTGAPAEAAPASTAYSTKAFWELTAALDEADLGCAAAACLTASAAKQEKPCSQRTAPAAQQQVLQQQPVVWRYLQPQHQQQQYLATSPCAQPKQGPIKAANGFRRLQTTPGTAMFSSVLNSMTDDLADSDECSDEDQEQPDAENSHGFTAVLQQELQEQLAAAAAREGSCSVGAAAEPEHMPAAVAAPSVNIGSSHSLGRSRSSQQDVSPTAAALAPPPAAAAAAATAEATGIICSGQTTEAINHQHSLAGQAFGSSAAAYISTEAQATAQSAASSPGSTTTAVEGDAEQFLVACLQPGVVQALAVLLHADILPLCSEDGTGKPHAVHACSAAIFDMQCMCVPHRLPIQPVASGHAMTTHATVTLHGQFPGSGVQPMFLAFTLLAVERRLHTVTTLLSMTRIICCSELQAPYWPLWRTCSS